MMSETVKQYAAVFLLLFLFLLVMPAVSHGAESKTAAGAGTVEDSGGVSPGQVPPSYSFPAGTTVEALTQQLAPQGPDEVLRVLKPDGSIRASGLIETGDTVEVLDGSGRVLSCVIAQVEAGSGSSSSQSSGSSQQDPSSVSLGQPEGNGYTVFSPGTTVEALQDELDAGGAQGCRLKVKSHAGRIRGSGNICTGDALSVLGEDGNVIFTTKAVVPGDLTRCGVPTDEACDLLYSHLIRRSELTGDLLDAADMNRDGAVDPSDLLLLKKAAAEFD